MGDLKIEEVKHNRIKGLRATFQVDHPRALVFETLWDLESFRKMFPDILELKLLSSSAMVQDVLYRIDAVYKEVSYVLRRTRSEERGGDVVRWKMLKGDPRDIIGSWQVYDVSGRDSCSTVVYESFVDASVLVPTSVVRKVAKTKLAEMVPRVRQAVANKAQA